MFIILKYINQLFKIVFVVNSLVVGAITEERRKKDFAVVIIVGA